MNTIAEWYIMIYHINMSWKIGPGLEIAGNSFFFKHIYFVCFSIYEEREGERMTLTYGKGEERIVYDAHILLFVGFSIFIPLFRLKMLPLQW